MATWNEILSEENKTKVLKWIDEGYLTEDNVDQFLDRLSREPAGDRRLERALESGFGANVRREWHDIKGAFADPTKAVDVFKEEVEQTGWGKTLGNIALSTITSTPRALWDIGTGKLGEVENPIETMVASLGIIPAVRAGAGLTSLASRGVGRFALRGGNVGQAAKWKAAADKASGVTQGRVWKPISQATEVGDIVAGMPEWVHELIGQGMMEGAAQLGRIGQQQLSSEDNVLDAIVGMAQRIRTEDPIEERLRKASTLISEDVVRRVMEDHELDSSEDARNLLLISAYKRWEEQQQGAEDDNERSRTEAVDHDSLTGSKTRPARSWQDLRESQEETAAAERAVQSATDRLAQTEQDTIDEETTRMDADVQRATEQMLTLNAQYAQDNPEEFANFRNEYLPLYDHLAPDMNSTIQMMHSDFANNVNPTEVLEEGLMQQQNINPNTESPAAARTRVQNQLKEMLGDELYRQYYGRTVDDIIREADQVTTEIIEERKQQQQEPEQEPEQEQDTKSDKQVAKRQLETGFEASEDAAAQRKQQQQQTEPEPEEPTEPTRMSDEDLSELMDRYTERVADVFTDDNKTSADLTPIGAEFVDELNAGGITTKKEVGHLREQLVSRAEQIADDRKKAADEGKPPPPTDEQMAALIEMHAQRFADDTKNLSTGPEFGEASQELFARLQAQFEQFGIDDFDELQEIKKQVQSRATEIKFPPKEPTPEPEQEQEKSLERRVSDELEAELMAESQQQDDSGKLPNNDPRWFTNMSSQEILDYLQSSEVKYVGKTRDKKVRNFAIGEQNAYSEGQSESIGGQSASIQIPELEDGKSTAVIWIVDRNREIIYGLEKEIEVEKLDVNVARKIVSELTLEEIETELQKGQSTGTMAWEGELSSGATPSPQKQEQQQQQEDTRSLERRVSDELEAELRAELEGDDTLTDITAEQQEQITLAGRWVTKLIVAGIADLNSRSDEADFGEFNMRILESLRNYHQGTANDEQAALAQRWIDKLVDAGIKDLQDRQNSDDFTEMSQRILDSLSFYKQHKAEGDATPSEKLETSILQILRNDETIPDNNAFFAIADEAYGSRNNYSPKEAYDVLDVSVNKYLEEQGLGNVNVSSDNAKQNIEAILEIERRLPTQNVQDRQQRQNQQYNTPYSYAYAVNWIAALSSNDVVFEPSAGTGNLAWYARANDAEVHVNELSERRVAMLRQMGFENITQEDSSAKTLKNYTSLQNLNPTVVVMNPPFSQTQGEKNLNLAGNMIEAAFDAMQPGGRLVAIVGGGLRNNETAIGMSHKSKGVYRKFFSRITQKGHLRADVPIAGRIYTKFGTSFNTRLLVIDKALTDTKMMSIYSSEFQGDLPISPNDNIESMPELIDLLGSVQNERKERQERLRSTIPQEPNQTPEGEQTQSQPESQRTLEGSGTDSTSRQTPRDRTDGVDTTGTTQTQQPRHGESSTDSSTPDRSETGDVVPTEPADTGVGTTPTGDRSTDGGSDTTETTRTEPTGDRTGSVQRTPDTGDGLPGRSDTTTTPDVAAEHTRIPEQHLTPLVESTALASTNSPSVDGVEVNLSDATLEIISEAQMKGIKLAIRATDRKIQLNRMVLEGDERVERTFDYQGGFLFGDDTGVGKTIQGLGFLLHEINQGNTKHLFISPRKDLYKQLAEDWRVIKGNSNLIFNASAVNAKKKIEQTKGVGFMTYGTLIQSPTEKSDTDRLGQILEYLVGIRPPLSITSPAFASDADASVDLPTFDEIVTAWELNRDDRADHFESRFGSEVVAIVKKAVRNERDRAKAEQDYRDLRDRQNRFRQLDKDTGATDASKFTAAAERFKGTLIFDESHLMRNDTSVTARMGLRLQRLLPNAKVIYMSATPVTRIDEMSYAVRLGLWGPGTSFNSHTDFSESMKRGGFATKEIVAKDMKALGLYIRRQLDYSGVTTENLIHDLSAQQETVYNAAPRLWSMLRNNMDAYMDHIIEMAKEVGEGAPQSAYALKRQLMQQFWSRNQDFYNAMLDTMKMESVFPHMKAKLDAGEKVVVQVVNTYEQSQNRQLARAAEDGTPLDMVKFTPLEMIYEYVENAFPIHERTTEFNPDTGKEEVVIRQQVKRDKNGNPMKDRDGNDITESVINQNAKETRDRMLNQLKDVNLPGYALDLFHQQMRDWGYNSVELSGRKKYYVRDKDGKRTEVKNPDGKQQKELDAFKEEKFKALAFSKKAGTGTNMPATTKGIPVNHYVIQSGWNIISMLQGLGRTMRAKRAEDPRYVLATVDLPASMRMSGAIVDKLADIGAAVSGQAKSSMGSRLAAREIEDTNAENEEDQEKQTYLLSEYGELALFNLWRKLHGGETITVKEEDIAKLQEVERTENIDGQVTIVTELQEQELGFTQVLALTQLAAGVNEQTGQIVRDEMPEAKQFLNRLMNMETYYQRALGEAFLNELDTVISAAIANDTLDKGADVIDVDSAQINKSIVINTDQKSGVETNLVEVGYTENLTRNDWNWLMNVVHKRPGFEGIAGQFLDIVQNNRSKVVWAVFTGPISVDAGGNQTRQYQRFNVRGTPSYITDDEYSTERYTSLTQPEGHILKLGGATTDQQTLAQAEAAWKQQDQEKPFTRADSLTMVTGALLPVWKKISPEIVGDSVLEDLREMGLTLDEFNASQKVKRLALSDGTLLQGRTVPSNYVPIFLQQFGVEAPEFGVEHANKQTFTVSELFNEQLLDSYNELTLDNGWILRKRERAGEARIAITGDVPDVFDSRDGIVSEFTTAAGFSYLIQSDDVGMEAFKQLLTEFPPRTLTIGTGENQQVIPVEVSDLEGHQTPKPETPDEPDPEDDGGQGAPPTPQTPQQSEPTERSPSQIENDNRIEAIRQIRDENPGMDLRGARETYEQRQQTSRTSANRTERTPQQTQGTTETGESGETETDEGNTRQLITDQFPKDFGGVGAIALRLNTIYQDARADNWTGNLFKMRAVYNALADYVDINANLTNEHLNKVFTALVENAGGSQYLNDQVMRDETTPETPAEQTPEPEDDFTYQGANFTEDGDTLSIVGDDIPESFWTYWHSGGRGRQSAHKKAMQDAGWKYSWRGSGKNRTYSFSISKTNFAKWKAANPDDGSAPVEYEETGTPEQMELIKRMRESELIYVRPEFNPIGETINEGHYEVVDDITAEPRRAYRSSDRSVGTAKAFQVSIGGRETLEKAIYPGIRVEFREVNANENNYRSEEIGRAAVQKALEKLDASELHLKEPEPEIDEEQVAREKAEREAEQDNIRQTVAAELDSGNFTKDGSTYKIFAPELGNVEVRVMRSTVSSPFTNQPDEHSATISVTSQADPKAFDYFYTGMPQEVDTQYHSEFTDDILPDIRNPQNWTRQGRKQLYEYKDGGTADIKKNQYSYRDEYTVRFSGLPEGGSGRVDVQKDTVDAMLANALGQLTPRLFNYREVDNIVQTLKGNIPEETNTEVDNTEHLQALGIDPGDYELWTADQRREQVYGIYAQIEDPTQEQADAYSALVGELNEELSDYVIAYDYRKAVGDQAARPEQTQRLRKLFNNIYRKKEPVNLIGEQLESAVEAAVLAQAYRDPEIETTRLFYVKNGKIIGHEGITLNKTNATAAPNVDLVGKRVRLLSADGFIVLHNHPSGVAKFSKKDSQSNVKLQSKFGNKFLGSIVIDSGTYAKYWKDDTGKMVEENEVTLPTDLVGWDTSSELIGARRVADPLYRHTDSPEQRAYSDYPQNAERNNWYRNIDAPAGTLTALDQASERSILALGQVLKVPENWITLAIAGNDSSLAAIVEYRDLQTKSPSELITFIESEVRKWGGTTTHIYVGEGNWYQSKADIRQIFTDEVLDTHGISSLVIAGDKISMKGGLQHPGKFIENPSNYQVVEENFPSLEARQALNRSIGEDDILTDVSVDTPERDSISIMPNPDDFAQDIRDNTGFQKTLNTISDPERGIRQIMGLKSRQSGRITRKTFSSGFGVLEEMSKNDPNGKDKIGDNIRKNVLDRQFIAKSQFARDAKRLLPVMNKLDKYVTKQAMPRSKDKLTPQKYGIRSDIRAEVSDQVWRFVEDNTEITNADLREIAIELKEVWRELLIEGTRNMIELTVDLKELFNEEIYITDSDGNRVPWYPESFDGFEWDAETNDFKRNEGTKANPNWVHYSIEEAHQKANKLYTPHYFKHDKLRSEHLKLKRMIESMNKLMQSDNPAEQVKDLGRIGIVELEAGLVGYEFIHDGEVIENINDMLEHAFEYYTRKELSLRGLLEYTDAGIRAERYGQVAPAGSFDGEARIGYYGHLERARETDHKFYQRDIRLLLETRRLMWDRIGEFSTVGQVHAIKGTSPRLEDILAQVRGFRKNKREFALGAVAVALKAGDPTSMFERLPQFGDSVEQGLQVQQDWRVYVTDDKGRRKRTDEYQELDIARMNLTDDVLDTLRTIGFIKKNDSGVDVVAGETARDRRITVARFFHEFYNTIAQREASVKDLYLSLGHWHTKDPLMADEAKFWQKISDLTTISTLSWSTAIQNLLEVPLLTELTGTRAMISGLAKMFGKESRQNLIDLSLGSSHVTRFMTETDLAEQFLGSWYSGFSKTDKFSRAVGLAAGLINAKRQIREYVLGDEKTKQRLRRVFNEIQLDTKIIDTLEQTELDSVIDTSEKLVMSGEVTPKYGETSSKTDRLAWTILKSMHYISDATFKAYDATSMPPFLNKQTPLVRLFMKYKGWMFQHNSFKMKNWRRAIREARMGNFRPFWNLAQSAVWTGATYGMMLSFYAMLRGNDEPPDALEALHAGQTLGMSSVLLEMASRADGNWWRLSKDMLGQAAGPTGSILTQVAAPAVTFDFDVAGKQTVRRIPVVNLFDRVGGIRFLENYGEDESTTPVRRGGTKPEL